MTLFFRFPNEYLLNLRYMFSLRPEIKKDKFTVEEDCILMAGIKEFGKEFNKFPPNFLPGRSTLQIRNRYNNVLQYVGKTSTWTLAHDEILLEQVKQHGTSNWAAIAKSLPHTRTSCRSRYTTVSKYLKSNPGSSLKDVPRRKIAPLTNVTEENWKETIIRIKSKDPSDSSNKKIKSSEWFEYFKCSYDFKYEPLRDPDDRVTASTHMVCQVLCNNICPLDFRMLHSSDIEKVNLQYLNFNGPMPEIEMPTNWCSSLLLRGLSIMYPSQGNMMHKFKDHHALTLFKQRFRTLIYNAAVEAQLRSTNASNEMIVYERKAADDFSGPERVDNIVACDSTVKSYTNEVFKARSESEATIEAYDLIKIGDIKEDDCVQPIPYTVQTNGGTFVITLTENKDTGQIEESLEPATKRKRNR